MIHITIYTWLMIFGLLISLIGFLLLLLAFGKTIRRDYGANTCFGFGAAFLVVGFVLAGIGSYNKINKQESKEKWESAIKNEWSFYVDGKLTDPIDLDRDNFTITYNDDAHTVELVSKEA